MYHKLLVCAALSRKLKVRTTLKIEESVLYHKLLVCAALSRKLKVRTTLKIEESVLYHKLLVCAALSRKLKVRTTGQTKSSRYGNNSTATSPTHLLNLLLQDYSEHTL